MTGRCPNDTTFSVDIGVTDATKTSRLFAVTSTTCSTPFETTTNSCCVFSTHRHQASTTVKHTQSVSVPIRHPSDKSSVYKLRDRHRLHIYIANTTRYQVHTYAVYSRVWRLWVVFLEHGGRALGIFKSPVCIYNQAWTFSLSASHYFSFLSKPSGRRMPPADRSALYLVLSALLHVIQPAETPNSCTQGSQKSQDRVDAKSNVS